MGCLLFIEGWDLTPSGNTYTNEPVLIFLFIILIAIPLVLFTNWWFNF